MSCSDLPKRFQDMQALPRGIKNAFDNMLNRAQRKNVAITDLPSVKNSNGLPSFAPLYASQTSTQSATPLPASTSPTNA